MYKVETELTDFAHVGESWIGALERALDAGLRVGKYADPIEPAREGLSRDECLEVVLADVGLLYVIEVAS